MLIYSDSQIIDLEWLPSINFPQDYQISHSIEEYVASDIEIKLAFTTHRLHCDYDINCTAYQGFEDKIKLLSQHSLAVFSFESELHNFHWGIWDKCFRENTYWCVPGFVNNSPINDNIICWGDFFKTTVLLYKHLPDKLAEIDPYKVKTKYFDALLGSPKPHRDFVFTSIQENNLQDKIICTYGGNWKENEFYAKEYFIWEEGTEPIGTIIGTADFAMYYGQRTHISQIIPIKVFNDSAYSIVTETDHDNTLSFFSEKTAKPMMARRLFVAFTGYKFLENLRRLGFRTFDGIIDEGYDQIEDDEARYCAAFDQVKFLCQADQEEIYAQAKEILEHNFNIVMTRDWTQYTADRITRIVQKLI
jgi:hypothetical protein